MSASGNDSSLDSANSVSRKKVRAFLDAASSKPQTPQQEHTKYLKTKRLSPRPMSPKITPARDREDTSSSSSASKPYNVSVVPRPKRKSMTRILSGRRRSVTGRVHEAATSADQLSAGRFSPVGSRPEDKKPKNGFLSSSDERRTVFPVVPRPSLPPATTPAKDPILSTNRGAPPGGALVDRITVAPAGTNSLTCSYAQSAPAPPPPRLSEFQDCSLSSPPYAVTK